MFRRLGFISGILLAIYVAAKSIDTLMWLNYYLASAGIRALGVLLSTSRSGRAHLFGEIVLLRAACPRSCSLPQDRTSALASDRRRDGLQRHAAESLRL